MCLIATHGHCEDAKSVLLFFCILRAERGCCGVIVVGKGNVASIGSVATPGRNACWGVPQTPKKRGETMTNRTRKIVLRVPVTPEERELIRQKMALLHTRNFSAYARKMLIDGYRNHSALLLVCDFPARSYRFLCRGTDHGKPGKDTNTSVYSKRSSSRSNGSYSAAPLFSK